MVRGRKQAVQDKGGERVGHGVPVALGLGASFAATGLVSSMLFDIPRTDPQVFAAVTLALLTSGFAACLLPARRATRVDAMQALRSE